MDERPHNTQDGRCRYTLGAERCPAPGVVRVGAWWVCALHEVWAERPQDPEMAEEGKAALRAQQERYKAPVVSPDGDVAGEGPEGPATAKEAALRALDAALGGELGRARAARRQRIGERAVELFGRSVRERRAAGVERTEAIWAAVREVAVAAVEQRWGTGR